MYYGKTREQNTKRLNKMKLYDDSITLSVCFYSFLFDLRP